MGKTLDLSQLKNQVLKVTLSIYVPNLESPDQGREVVGETFIELTPMLSNADIMKKTKQLLLDLREAVKAYKPAPPQIVAQAANHNLAPVPALVGFDKPAIIEPDMEGTDVPVFNPPPVEHNKKD